MDSVRPFILEPLGDGRHELIAFSDNSDDPIRIVLDEGAGRRLARALGEALSLLDAPGAEPQDFEVVIGERRITVSATPGSPLRVTVTR